MLLLLHQLFEVGRRRHDEQAADEGQSSSRESLVNDGINCTPATGQMIEARGEREGRVKRGAAARRNDPSALAPTQSSEARSFSSFPSHS